MISAKSERHLLLNRAEDRSIIPVFKLLASHLITLDLNYLPLVLIPSSFDNRLREPEQAPIDPNVDAVQNKLEYRNKTNSYHQIIY